MSLILNVFPQDTLGKKTCQNWNTFKFLIFNCLIKHYLCFLYLKIQYSKCGSPESVFRIYETGAKRWKLLELNIFSDNDDIWLIFAKIQVKGESNMLF